MEFTCSVPSPLGEITLCSDGAALTGLYFDAGDRFPPALFPECADLPVFREAEKWLAVYFSGRDPGFTPALRLIGTPFRRRVWELLLTIPYGRTATYGEIAREIARERGIPVMAAQAVGGAVGANPVSLIVPCHRVIGSGGKLTGYGGGLWRKTALLEAEEAGKSAGRTE